MSSLVLPVYFSQHKLEDKQNLIAHKSCRPRPYSPAERTEYASQVLSVAGGWKSSRTPREATPAPYFAGWQPVLEAR